MSQLSAGCTVFTLQMFFVLLLLLVILVCNHIPKSCVFCHFSPLKVVNIPRAFEGSDKCSYFRILLEIPVSTIAFSIMQLDHLIRNRDEEFFSVY